MTLVYIGTQGQGIFAARLDEATGALTHAGLAAEIERPTWVLRDPARPVLYAVSEVGNAGDREAAVWSLAIGEDGALRPISSTGSGGGGATHLALAPDGRTLFVANFGGGQVGAIPVSGDGALGAVTSLQAQSGTGPHRRQQAPHPHGVTLDPGERWLLAPDMGADRIFVYRFDAAAQALTPAEPPFVQLPAGSGPRLILFGRDGRFAYLLTELSAELYVFAWEDGRLEQIGCTPLDLPGAEGPPNAAALTLSGDGRFLYASNRSTNAIQVYAIDPDSGLLDEVQRVAAGGVKPWGAEISPGGRWMLVANQGSDAVCVFAVDAGTGRLTAVGEALAVPTPTGIAFA